MPDPIGPVLQANQLSAEEIAYFRKRDTNGDGKVTAKELITSADGDHNNQITSYDAKSEIVGYKDDSYFSIAANSVGDAAIVRSDKIAQAIDNALASATNQTLIPVGTGFFEHPEMSYDITSISDETVVVDLNPPPAAAQTATPQTSNSKADVAPAKASARQAVPADVAPASAQFSPTAISFPTR